MITMQVVLPDNEATDGRVVIRGTTLVAPGTRKEGEWSIPCTIDHGTGTIVFPDVNDTVALAVFLMEASAQRRAVEKLESPPSVDG